MELHQFMDQYCLDQDRNVIQYTLAIRVNYKDKLIFYPCATDRSENPFPKGKIEAKSGIAIR